jgi:putative ABC transport system ATP-binding protein
MLLTARGLSRTYGSGSAEVVALKATSFDVAEGEYVAIIGASGSGKSTLMSLLGLLDRPSSGSLFMGGLECGKLGDVELAQLRNRRIGFVFQSYLLLPRLAAWRNVELPLVYGRMAKGERRDLVMEALDRVGLLAKADRLPNQLSGGEQQRVAIARAIVAKPTLLLADEPTGALDSVAGRVVLDLLNGIHMQGCTIIIVTHDRSVASEAQRILTMRDGELVSDRANAVSGVWLREVTQ